jgi:hypothetical protein
MQNLLHSRLLCANKPHRHTQALPAPAGSGKLVEGINHPPGTPKFCHFFKSAWKIPKLIYVTVIRSAITNIDLFLLFSGVVVGKINFEWLRGGLAG